MATRTQTMVRRGINRLDELIQRNVETNPALSAIAVTVASARESVNQSWQSFQSAAVAGDRERTERDEAIEILLNWVQQWRPVILLLVPGADQNIRNLPASGATPDDIIRVAEDMVAFMGSNPQTGTFSENAVNDLGNKLEAAKKETGEATAALPAEALTRNLYSEACLNANTVLVRSLDVVRTVFGPTSPEYKQFISKSSKKQEDEIDQESQLGEN